jgi:hypothetical protein
MQSEVNVNPKIYNLLSRCIEDGIRRGYRRAHKHVESPAEDSIFLNIEECIMGEITEWFDFEEFKR